MLRFLAAYPYGIEEAFGWAKTVAGLRNMRHRGLPKVGWQFTLLNAAAYSSIWPHPRRGWGGPTLNPTCSIRARSFRLAMCSCSSASRINRDFTVGVVACSASALSCTARFFAGHVWFVLLSIMTILLFS